jgi:uncharacterized SAM-binding protein YcdF (DUF218 family)
MFHFLSKTIGLLAGPMSLLFMLLLAAWIVRNKAWKKRLRWAFLIALILFSNPFISNELMLVWETPPVEMASLNAPYESAIVLTGMTNFEKSPKDRVHFSLGSDRLFQAIWLYKQGYVKKIVISGGGALIIQKDIKEGRSLYEYCLAIGIPAEDLLLEENSRNTRENALFSKALMEENFAPDSRHLLITSAFHMRRARACFTKIGMQMDVFPVDYHSSDRKFLPKYLIFPNVNAIKQWEMLLQETIGYTAYSLSGYI